MADPKITPNAKAKVYIGTTASDPTGDVYAEISGAEGFTPSGTVGGEQDVTTKDLLCGEIQIGGLVRNGTVDVTYAVDDTDAGQVALAAANHDDLIYNFKVEKNDMPNGGAHGTQIYVKARVTANGEAAVSASETVAMGVAKLAVSAWSAKVLAV